MINCLTAQTNIFVLNIDTMVLSEKSFASVGIWRSSALVRMGLVRVASLFVEALLNNMAERGVDTPLGPYKTCPIHIMNLLHLF